jgi:hypothetical protein
LALTSPTIGDRSVGIVRWRTQATEFFLWRWEADGNVPGSCPAHGFGISGFKLSSFFYQRDGLCFIIIIIIIIIINIIVCPDISGFTTVNKVCANEIRMGMEMY